MDELYILLDAILFVLNVLCAFLFNYVFSSITKNMTLLPPLPQSRIYSYCFQQLLHMEFG